jgi:hypothetical protein
MTEREHDMLEAESVPMRMRAEPVRGPKPWLHALAVYLLAMVLGSGFWWLQYHLRAAANAWAWPILATQVALTTAAFAALGWAFDHTRRRWIWAGVIGFIFAILGPNVFVIAGFFGNPAALLQGLSPALATLILYRGAARVTGIWLLSIVLALYISLYALILIALSNWHFQF